jgi:hypothetical protein
MTREELIDAIGRQTTEGVSHRAATALPWAAPDLHTACPAPNATRHTLLSGLHELLRPRTYFEIGVDLGQSLSLSRTKSLAVDPAFTINRTINGDVQIFRKTSDDFFALEEAFAKFDSVPVDLAFIDGLHQSLIFATS